VTNLSTGVRMRPAQRTLIETVARIVQP
jgi:hypothetical protein